MKRASVICSRYLAVVAAAVAMMAAASLHAAAKAGKFDWPQWRGPDRNSITAETGWQTRWPADGPKVKWSVDVGGGYSSVAVRAGRVYTMGNDGSKDTVWCLNEATGAVVWKKSYPERRGQYPGPRATPTVEGDLVYTVSRQGLAKCYKADSGEQVWSTNIPAKIGAKVPGWGIAGSPLVLGDRVIYSAGTAGVALNKADGSLLWQTGTGKSSYASPVRYNMDGKETVLVFAARALYCVAIADGERLWSVPWKTAYDVNAPDPVVVAPNTIFICSGYRAGSALIKVTGGKPEIVWRKKDMSSHFPSPILYKGHLYGCHGNVGSGRLQCMNAATGEVKWSGPRIGMASPILAVDKLIVQGDRGRLVVADASPAGYKAIAEARLPMGQCWSIPVLANGQIYCRSSGAGSDDPGKLICLDVSR